MSDYNTIIKRIKEIYLEEKEVEEKDNKETTHED
jgi:hypothetical protein